MQAVTILGLISIFFAWLESSRKYKNGLTFSIAIIFLFLSLRYNFGNDYLGYQKYFEEFNVHQINDIFDYSQPIEWGWQFLNRIFQPFGFYSMIAFLALFNCIVYYKFIKTYVPLKYYWFAIFLYVFSPYMMLVNVSAMRQSVAISIFLSAVHFLFKKQIIYYLILIFFASLFHASALVLLPLYFLKFNNLKINNLAIFLIVIIFILSVFTIDYYKDDLAVFTTQFFTRYSIYEVASSYRIGLAIPFSIIILIILLKFYNFQKTEAKILFTIAILGILLIPIAIIIPMSSRILFYFQIVLIAVYPLILSSSNNPVFKSFFTLIITIYTLFMYFNFFEASTWKDAYETYQTIFSTL